MEKQNVQPTAAQTEAPVTPRQPYEPPKATFVPLRLEERLLSCALPKMDLNNGCVVLLPMS